MIGVVIWRPENFSTISSIQKLIRKFMKIVPCLRFFFWHNLSFNFLLANEIWKRERKEKMLGPIWKRFPWKCRYLLQYSKWKLLQYFVIVVVSANITSQGKNFLVNQKFSPACKQKYNHPVWGALAIMPNLQQLCHWRRRRRHHRHLHQKYILL